IDTMFPKTIDEIKAEGENEMLLKDEMPDVAETDNHETHIYIHRMVQPKTNATWFHIAWHEELLAKQKQQEQQMAQMNQSSMAPLGGKGNVGEEKSNPISQT